MRPRFLHCLCSYLGGVLVLILTMVVCVISSVVIETISAPYFAGCGPAAHCCKVRTGQGSPDAFGERCRCQRQDEGARSFVYEPHGVNPGGVNPTSTVPYRHPRTHSLKHTTQCHFAPCPRRFLRFLKTLCSVMQGGLTVLHEAAAKGDCNVLRVLLSPFRTSENAVDDEVRAPNTLGGASCHRVKGLTRASNAHYYLVASCHVVASSPSLSL